MVSSIHSAPLIKYPYIGHCLSAGGAKQAGIDMAESQRGPGVVGKPTGELAVKDNDEVTSTCRI